MIKGIDSYAYFVAVQNNNYIIVVLVMGVYICCPNK